MGSLDNLVPFTRKWTIPEAATLACLLEASSPKAGNVHPAASFRDMSFAHFAASAIAIRSAVEQHVNTGVGELILSAVRETRSAVSCNTNLGTVLLLGPLAVAAAHGGIATQLPNVLRDLDEQDSSQIYEAIQHAQPGGMGAREEDDVRGAAPSCIVDAMRQVSEFDAVARQYTNNFADVCETLVPWLEEILLEGWEVDESICRLQLRWLAKEPDGLILRKVGKRTASEVQQRAQTTLNLVGTSPIKQSPDYQDLDHYLRSDGHRLNPGTTADLIAATLFVKLLEG